MDGFDKRVSLSLIYVFRIGADGQFPTIPGRLDPGTHTVIATIPATFFTLNDVMDANGSDLSYGVSVAFDNSQYLTVFPSLWIIF